MLKIGWDWKKENIVIVQWETTKITILGQKIMFVQMHIRCLRKNTLSLKNPPIMDEGTAVRAKVVAEYFFVLTFKENLNALLIWENMNKYESSI